MKKHLLSLIAVAALVLSYTGLPNLHAQTGALYTLSNTTLSAAVTGGLNPQRTITVASASASSFATEAPAVGQELFVDLEAMTIRAISSTTFTVDRGVDGTTVMPHPSGAIVFTGDPERFQQGDPPYGSCVATAVIVRPWINVTNGNVWLCRSSLWKATNVQPLVYDSVSVF